MDEIQKVEQTSLANFGGRDPIKEMAQRLKLMMPNATKYADGEAMAIAQLAYAHDLDPFNGEVWGIGSGGNWKGVTVGIKGLRKAAKREADRENSVYWFDVPQQVNPKDYGVDKPGAVAYKQVLRDSATTQAWAKSINSLTTAGIPYAEAVKMMGGNPPCVIGIGIADPGEPSKMALHARAKKRGEAEALKIRYSLEFRGASVSVEDAPIDAEINDLPAAQLETMPEPAPAVNEQDIIDELFPAETEYQAPAPKVDANFPPSDAESAAEKLTRQQHRHAALFAKVQKAGVLNQTTLEVWKRRANDTAEIIAEKCDLMHAALKEAGAE